MASLSRAHGGKLIVPILGGEDAAGRQYYARMLDRHDVLVRDCTHESAGTPEFRVIGEGHPNEAMNDHWLECVAPMVDAALDAIRRAERAAQAVESRAAAAVPIAPAGRPAVHRGARLGWSRSSRS